MGVVRSSRFTSWNVFAPLPLPGASSNELHASFHHIQRLFELREGRRPDDCEGTSLALVKSCQRASIHGSGPPARATDAMRPAHATATSTIAVTRTAVRRIRGDGPGRPSSQYAVNPSGRGGQEQHRGEDRAVVPTDGVRLAVVGDPRAEKGVDEDGNRREDREPEDGQRLERCPAQHDPRERGERRHGDPAARVRQDDGHERAEEENGAGRAADPAARPVGGEPAVRGRPPPRTAARARSSSRPASGGARPPSPPATSDGNTFPASAHAITRAERDREPRRDRAPRCDRPDAEADDGESDLGRLAVEEVPRQVGRDRPPDREPAPRDEAAQESEERQARPVQPRPRQQPGQHRDGEPARHEQRRQGDRQEVDVIRSAAEEEGGDHEARRPRRGPGQKR